MDTFEHAEVGDTVLLHNRQAALPVVTEIIKVTKTQIILNYYAMRFRRKSGEAVAGGSWPTHHITWPKEGEIETILAQHKRRNLIDRIVRGVTPVQLRDVPTENLEKICSLLKRYEGESE